MMHIFHVYDFFLMYMMLGFLAAGRQCREVASKYLLHFRRLYAS